MYDELPAPPTRDESSDDSTAEPTDARRERDDRPGRRERPGHDEESPATGSASPRARDGVDPPDDASAVPPDDALDCDDADGDDCDGDDEDGADGEPHACRLERLRLWRTLATLAVVVARLIRSL
ncbi:hypothetical protein U4E84_09210 [Halorubrum sp. AD140]|uniref:hypothetical protein n=1 Tax=Halorubrum sp. AD140 TaxID=3050073 RepID=UPI002ACC8C53|nr:hypothetical protein [Halorubrum sp. AD140]MDZ5811521.1 hypothetical protein [Halorubrum sp. AD140]